MLTSLNRRAAGLPRIPLAILLLTILVVTIGQVAAHLPGGSTVSGDVAVPGVVADPGGAADPGGPVALDPLAPAVETISSADLDRIRADTAFWGDRFRAEPA